MHSCDLSLPPPPGNFSLALFTMFQFATGDGWAEFIARPQIGNQNPYLFPDLGTATRSLAGSPAAGGGGALLQDGAAVAGPTALPQMRRAVAVFFVLSFFVLGIALLGIVHATLLDEFMDAVQKERQRFRELEVPRVFSPRASRRLRLGGGLRAIRAAPAVQETAGRLGGPREFEFTPWDLCMPQAWVCLVSTLTA